MKTTTKTTFTTFTLLSVLLLSNATYAQKNQATNAPSLKGKSTSTDMQAAQIADATFSNVKSFFAPRPDNATLYPALPQ